MISPLPLARPERRAKLCRSLTVAEEDAKTSSRVNRLVGLVVELVDAVMSFPLTYRPRVAEDCVLPVAIPDATSTPSNGLLQPSRSVAVGPRAPDTTPRAIIPPEKVTKLVDTSTGTSEGRDAHSADGSKDTGVGGHGDVKVFTAPSSDEGVGGGGGGGGDTVTSVKANSDRYSGDGSCGTNGVGDPEMAVSEAAVVACARLEDLNDGKLATRGGAACGRMVAVAPGGREVVAALVLLLAAMAASEGDM